MTQQQIVRKFELERLPKHRLIALLTEKRRATGIIQVYGAPVAKLSRSELAREIAELEARS